MSGAVLVLRPEPGASSTAAKARELGLEAYVAPLFEVHPIAWDMPDLGEIDAVILTSANAARLGGSNLSRLRRLRCYAVGETTAAAARAAGFEDVRVGPSDGAALIEEAAAAGVRRALRLCGRDHTELRHPEVTVIRRIVYASDAVDELPADAGRAIDTGALVLIHSPRAAAHFAALADRANVERQRVRLALISGAAAEAAGSGWREKAVTARPRDDALLELAAKLCQTGLGREERLE